MPRQGIPKSFSEHCQCNLTRLDLMDSLYCEMIITIEPTLCSVQSTKISVKFSGPLFLEITHARDHLQFLYYLGPVTSGHTKVTYILPELFHSSRAEATHY